MIMTEAHVEMAVDMPAQRTPTTPQVPPNTHNKPDKKPHPGVSRHNLLELLPNKSDTRQGAITSITTVL